MAAAPQHFAVAAGDELPPEDRPAGSALALRAGDEVVVARHRRFPPALLKPLLADGGFRIEHRFTSPEGVALVLAAPVSHTFF